MILSFTQVRVRNDDRIKDMMRNLMMMMGGAEHTNQKVTHF